MRISISLILVGTLIFLTRATADLPFLGEGSMPDDLYGEIDLHNHTNDSDEENNIDHQPAPSPDSFCQKCAENKVSKAFSDHSEVTTGAEWRHRQELANRCVADDQALINGYEWTKGGVIFSQTNKDFAHVVVLNTENYIGTARLVPGCEAIVAEDLEKFWQVLDAELGENGVAGFAHPWHGKKDPFNDFAIPDGLVNVQERVCWVEIAGGPRNFRAMEGVKYLCQAIQAGRRVGPAYGGDNFGNPFPKPEDKPGYTGVVLTEGGTNYKEKMLRSIRARRIFMSEVNGVGFDWGLYDNADYQQSLTKMGGNYNYSRFGPPDNIVAITTKAGVQNLMEGMIWLVYSDRVEEFDLMSITKSTDYGDALAGEMPIAEILGLRTDYGIRGWRWVISAPIWFE